MSRIDEARRRAAELASCELAEGSRRVESLTPLPLCDATRLNSEAFPPEKAGRLHSQDIKPGLTKSVSQRPSAGLRVAAEQAADDVTPDSLADGWFESLDARLRHKVIGAAQMSPASREQYHRLAATLHNAQLSNGVKVIMVASAVASEGKTLTA